MKIICGALTALIPQTAIVSPNLNIAELSACLIDETFTLAGRNDKNFLPSVRMSCSCKCQVFHKKHKLYNIFLQTIYVQNTYKMIMQIFHRMDCSANALKWIIKYCRNEINYNFFLLLSFNFTN